MGDISVAHGQLAARGPHPDQPSPQDKLKASLRALAAQMRLLSADEGVWTVRSHAGLRFAYISTNGEFGGKMHTVSITSRSGERIQANWIGSETMVLDPKATSNETLENIANTAQTLTQWLAAENKLKNSIKVLATP